AAAVLLFPYAASAQQAGAPSPRLERLAAQMVNAQQTNVPPEVQRAEAAVERAVRRFRMGVQGGVGIDPELIMFGAHGAFGPFFAPTLEFRPGVEIGIGEVTTALSINLDVLYTLPGATRGTRWTPYIGAGPNFSLSHRSFEADDDFDRFDFSDTSFQGGFNFIAGARAQNGMFLELKGTAYGVSNIRLLVGFNF
ncbi:MAG: hypothetical protein H0U94_08625, partial [Acidobacteria bacterium]|nr:hypothetical protein [Acidobacteriota bacterium]